LALRCGKAAAVIARNLALKEANMAEVNGERWNFWRSIHLGNVIEIAVIVLGGMWAVSEFKAKVEVLPAMMESKIAAVSDQLRLLQEDLNAQINALQVALQANTGRLDGRIDTIMTHQPFGERTRVQP
jgi:hypothetical protein